MKKNYLHRQACFACTTPYQVLGAISIVLERKMKADLYIFGFFPGYEQVADRLRKHDVFAHVFAVDTTQTRIPGRWKGFRQMVFAERTVAPFLPKDVAYDTFYSSSRAPIKTILLHVLQKRNPEMEQVIFEDGLGTYARNSHMLNTTRMKALAEKLLRWNLYDPARIRCMAYLPELVNLPEELKDCPVEQMPRIRWEGSSQALLEDVYGAGPEDQITQRVIIFDTLRGNRTGVEILDCCYERVSDVFGRENLMCKPHPKSIEASRVDIPCYQRQSLPMEVLYSGMEDIEDRVLIAYVSTAVFTPKILFGKEPRVICLYRISEKMSHFTKFEEIYQKFRGLYSDPLRVSAPRSLEELEALLEELRIDLFSPSEAES